MERKIWKALAAVAVGSVMVTAAQGQDFRRVGWIGEDRYPIQFYSNVTAQDMIPLLAGHAWVDEFQDGLNTHALRIQWYGTDGNAYFCAANATPGPDIGKFGPATHAKWQPIIIDAQQRHVKYPLLMTTGVVPLANGKTDVGYGLLRYDPKTGGLSNYIYSDRRWLRAGTGRLQKELPAVIWKLCPDFPSAKSLGATVDQRQTATTYDEVIAQGGTPILRPDLVTAHPEQKY